MKHCLPRSCEMWNDLPWLNPSQFKPHLDQAYTKLLSHDDYSQSVFDHWQDISLVNAIFSSSFVLSAPHCRSIQIVWSACYTWCYRITIQKWNLAVQYSMYSNVCCAININVYNIFYNTEDADLIYDMSWPLGRNVALENYLSTFCMFFLFSFTWEKHLKGSLWTNAPCTSNGCI